MGGGRVEEDEEQVGVRHLIDGALRLGETERLRPVSDLGLVLEMQLRQKNKK